METFPGAWRADGCRYTSRGPATQLIGTVHLLLRGEHAADRKSASASKWIKITDAGMLSPGSPPSDARYGPTYAQPDCHSCGLTWRFIAASATAPLPGHRSVKQFFTGGPTFPHIRLGHRQQC
ncbi:hypothetical protein GCM10010493_23250 [Streptomyces lavendulae subsp. grasserius]